MVQKNATKKGLHDSCGLNNAIQITMHLMHSHIADFLLLAIEYDNAAVFTNIFSPICADDV